MTRRERAKALKELYARMPRVRCQGKCAASCGPIECSDLEFELIEKRAGRKLTTVHHPMRGPLTCSMLSANGHCTIYGIRPVVCRLWGAIPEMPCPHGCEVINPVARGKGYEFIVEAHAIGGGKRARLEIADLRRALEALDDPAFQRIGETIIANGMRNDRAKMGL